MYKMQPTVGQKLVLATMDIDDDKQTEAFWCDVCASHDAGGGVGTGRAWQQQGEPQVARAQSPSMLPGTKDQAPSHLARNPSKGATLKDRTMRG